METPPNIPEEIPQTLPPQPIPTTEPNKRQTRFPAILVAVILLIGLLGGGLVGYSLSYATFNGRIDNLQTQLQNLPPTNATYVSYANTTYTIGDNVSLAVLYQQVRSSVVVVQGLIPQYNFFGYLVGYAQQQGSGFVTMANNQPVIVTNNHVVQDTINITVTFANGDSYSATTLGADPLADIAVITINQASSDLQPLILTSSSTLNVGDPVVAIGSPYGLSGTLTTGVISALGRTITESDGTQNGGINIPDVIQTSTAINPGNSGGPLVNYKGEVIGITTAAVSNSQGLGFAIPSDTILREITSLVTTGSYTQHPSLNAVGIDMNQQIAKAIGVNVTYGWLVETLSTQNGLTAGNRQITLPTGERILAGGDIIIGIGGTRITNGDDMLSYLERHTTPGQTIDFFVVREGITQTVAVTIGKL